MIKWLRSKKKYSSLVTLVCLLLLSWFYLQRAQKNSREELHSLLQEKVQLAISNYIEKNNPYITSITFHKVWTKNSNFSTDIIIFFTYSLVIEQEAGANLLVDGEAILSQSDKDEDHWVLNDFKVTNSSLDFSEPMLIKASSKN